MADPRWPPKFKTITTGNMPVQRQKEPTISPDTWKLVEIFVAETVGTAMLMFFGCMGLILWKVDASLPHWQGPVVFAVVVATIVQTFAHISGAHINPVVTICFLLLGQIKPLTSIVYFVAEMFGAILGFGLLKLITPCDILKLNENLCSTMPHPNVNDLQAIASEFMATSVLIIVICALTDPRNAQHASTISLKFAATIIGIALTLGPYTGTSMNPARSFAPALWNGTWDKHWIYWLGPTVGSVVTTIFYQTMFIPKTPALTEPVEEDIPLNGIKVNTQKDEVKEENE